MIPVAPGVFSSFGMVVADHSHYARASYLAALNRVEAAELERRFTSLEEQAAGQLRHDTGETPTRLRRSAAMRYALQEWELPVELPPGPFGCDDLDAIRDRFHKAHHARYGFAREDRPVELVALLVSASVRAPAVAYGATNGRDAARPAEGQRTWPVVVDPREGRVDVVVHARDGLRAGDELHGPLVVTEPTSTTYVQPGWTLVVDGMGNLVARAA